MRLSRRISLLVAGTGILGWIWLTGAGGSSHGAGMAASDAGQSLDAAIAAVQKFYQAWGVPTPDAGELRRPLRPARLNLPTMMTRVAGRWFVVDSYNNRVLYHADPTAPLGDWQLLDGDLSRPHSIAGNDSFLAVDDTEAHSLRVYRAEGDGYQLHQVFVDVGARPHRVWYDPSTDRFYVLSANSQELTVYSVGLDGLEQIARQQVAAIAGAYTRSFRIIDGVMWLFSANGTVSVVEHDTPKLPLVARYTVQESLANINDMIRVGDNWYLSATRNRLATCRLLTDDDRGHFSCTDLGHAVDYTGNPYLFDLQDDTLMLGIVAGRDTVLRLGLDSSGRLESVGEAFSGRPRLQ